MPGKAKKEPEKGKKAEKKIKEKIIEDKTFGLKNKNKSASVQKYIKGVQQQVKGVAKGGERAEIAAQIQSKEEKKKAQADQLLLASLFKSVVDMPKGQDPKTMICSFYKSGLCLKGAKCKFSHDLTFEPVKEEKPDLYTDTRPVVSEIICQFFQEAVESEKHGWFWKCPNGDECIYRHALPEGYVFKREEAKVDVDEEEKISLEEQLDTERNKLPLGQKPVTKEEFMSWVEKDNFQREEEKRAIIGTYKGLSGRALFEANSGLFQDDEDAYEDYQREVVVEEFDSVDQRLLHDIEEEEKHKEEDQEAGTVENKKSDDLVIEGKELEEGVAAKAEENQIIEDNKGEINEESKEIKEESKEIQEKLKEVSEADIKKNHQNSEPISEDFSIKNTEEKHQD